VLVIVETCTDVVEVMKLTIDFIDFSTGEFHQGYEDGHIIGNGEELTVLIF
jgi:hypothetical protein